MNLIDFIVKLFNITNRNELTKCFSKSTIIVYDGTNILLANDKYIYYFGSIKPLTKKFKLFYDSVYIYMKNKIFISKDITMYKNHCKEIDNGRYIWL